MGIDWLKGEITPDQERMERILVAGLIKDMLHGDEAYFHAENYWVDPDTREIWIDGNAPKFTPEEIAEIEWTDDDESERPPIPIRCIRINEGDVDGYIIDSSYFDMVPDGSLHEQIVPSFGPSDTDHTHVVDPRKCVGWIGSDTGMENLAKILEKQFGIEIGGCAVRSAIEAEMIVKNEVDETRDEPPEEQE